MTPEVTVEEEPIIVIRVSMDDARKLRALINKVQGNDLGKLYNKLADATGDDLAYDVTIGHGMPSSTMAFIKMVRA